jgi:hypothetical protein
VERNASGERIGLFSRSHAGAVIVIARAADSDIEATAPIVPR